MISLPFLTSDSTIMMDLRKTPAKVSQHPYGMTFTRDFGYLQPNHPTSMAIWLKVIIINAKFHYVRLQDPSSILKDL
jgi:hypothetical protein